MTKEERDILQRHIDKYVELEEGDGDNGRIAMMKMNLGIMISRLIPDLEIGGVDLTMILNPLLHFFAPKINPPPGVMAVVDGHIEEWSRLEEEYGKSPGGVPVEVEDRFMSEYGIRIPFELVREAIRIKSTNKLVDMAFANRGKDAGT